jgi:hypothetical protein
MLRLTREEGDELRELLSRRAQAAGVVRESIRLPDEYRSSFRWELWWAIHTLLQDRPVFFIAGAIAVPTYLCLLVDRLIRRWL